MALVKGSPRSGNPLVSYNEVRKRIGKRTSYLLLGNGFSIACDPIFRYESVYEAAVEKGLSKRAQELFGRLGTNNFEGVMMLLDDSHWVAQVYGLVKDKSEMLKDLEIIKKTLISVIAKYHLPHPVTLKTTGRYLRHGLLNPTRLFSQPTMIYCCSGLRCSLVTRRRFKIAFALMKMILILNTLFSQKGWAITAVSYSCTVHSTFI
jgi:hypothetical protein